VQPGETTPPAEERKERKGAKEEEEEEESRMEGRNTGISGRWAPRVTTGQGPCLQTKYEE